MEGGKEYSDGENMVGEGEGGRGKGKEVDKPCMLSNFPK